MFSAERAANVHEIGRDVRFLPRLPSGTLAAPGRGCLCPAILQFLRIVRRIPELVSSSLCALCAICGKMAVVFVGLRAMPALHHLRSLRQSGCCLGSVAGKACAVHVLARNEYVLWQIQPLPTVSVRVQTRPLTAIFAVRRDQHPVKRPVATPAARFTFHSAGPVEEELFRMLNRVCDPRAGAGTASVAGSLHRVCCGGL